MKVYVLIKDETDYNGYRTVVGVYESEEMALKVAALETSMAQGRAQLRALQQKDDAYLYWVPTMNIEETEYYDD